MADPNPTQTNPVDVEAIDDAIARTSSAAGFGLTDTGFVPKPFARVLAEKLALARMIFGADIDLGAGSALRKILEISAVEDARTWSALAGMYDNQFVTSARGDALSQLGHELGFPRPYLEARGTVKLTANLPKGVDGVALPQGARMLTAGFHHVALDEDVSFSADALSRNVAVVAFYPGPTHNLDPAADPLQKITRWNPDDPKLGWDATSLLTIAATQDPNVAPEQIVAIEHTQPLTGGNLRWPDARYRTLLLRAPRSIWTVDSIRIALSLVPGVRQVQVRDRVGGLDVDLPIFGTFSFVERLFGAERDLASPYTFDVLVASTESAIWDGADGLGVALETAIQDLRPLGILPRVQPADQVNVSVTADIVVQGLALPRGASSAAINASPVATELKRRLLARIANYVNTLGIGDPVRHAEIVWAMMSEPGVKDVTNVQLAQFPPRADGTQPAVGDNVDVRPTQIATLVASYDTLRVV